MSVRKYHILRAYINNKYLPWKICIMCFDPFVLWTLQNSNYYFEEYAFKKHLMLFKAHIFSKYLETVTIKKKKQVNIKKASSSRLAYLKGVLQIWCKSVA